MQTNFLSSMPVHPPFLIVFFLTNHFYNPLDLCSFLHLHQYVLELFIRIVKYIWFLIPIMRLYFIVDGIWNNWSSWSTCNVTCNDGTQTRFRTCTNPAPAFNGKDCAGYSLEYKQCMNDFCPCNEFFELSKCSQNHFCTIYILRISQQYV